MLWHQHLDLSQASFVFIYGQIILVCLSRQQNLAESPMLWKKEQKISFLAYWKEITKAHLG